MSELEINTKLKHISSMIFKIIIQNKIVAYEEYSNLNNNDSRIEEFEKLQINKYKNTIDKWIINSEIDKKIEEYILLEKDPYGLQTNKINLINDINDSFFDLEREMIIDSAEIRDCWKKLLFDKYTEEISQLKLNLEESNKIKEDIEFKLTQSESEKRKIEDKLTLCERSKQKIKDLSEMYKSEKEQLRKTLIIKNKEINSIADEKEKLDNEIKKINSMYQELKEKFEVVKSENVKSETTQKEINHYKKLLNSAKEIKIKYEQEVSEYMDMIKNLNDDLNNINRDINHKENIINNINKQLIFNKNELDNKDIIIRRKEKEIEDLKRKLNETIKISNEMKAKTKMTLGEFKEKCNKPIIEIQNVLQIMVRRERSIDGESASTICREPYGILKDIKSCQSVEEGVELINKLIHLLSDIKKKCNRNGLDYDLDSGIEKLYELKEKNS